MLGKEILGKLSPSKELSFWWEGATVFIATRSHYNELVWELENLFWCYLHLGVFEFVVLERVAKFSLSSISPRIQLTLLIPCHSMYYPTSNPNNFDSSQRLNQPRLINWFYQKAKSKSSMCFFAKCNDHAAFHDNEGLFKTTGNRVYLLFLFLLPFQITKILINPSKLLYPVLLILR